MKMLLENEAGDVFEVHPTAVNSLERVMANDGTAFIFCEGEMHFNSDCSVRHGTGGHYHAEIGYKDPFWEVQIPVRGEAEIVAAAHSTDCPHRYGTGDCTCEGQQ